jgi:hypothetical protein
MEKGKLDDIIQSSISQTVKISEDDTQKNAEAVKLSILSDIQHMIDLKTQPLIEKINVLQKVNRQLTNDLDNNTVEEVYYAYQEFRNQSVRLSPRKLFAI